MNISVDISLYPLHEDYKDEIIAFIEALKANNSLNVVVNGMSTQVFGSFESVMNVLQQEMKSVLSQEARSVIILKISQGELTPENLPPALK